MLTSGFGGITTLIILQIIVLPQGISGDYELAYLAKNEDDDGSKFWLLQESDKYLSFTWIPFSPLAGYEFELELHLKIVSSPSIILREDTTSAPFEAIGYTCEYSRYSITRKTTESWRRTAGSHELYYKRIPRIENVKQQSGEPRSVTWEQESAFCNSDDVTIIFSGQDDQPLEMIIVQGDEKKYTLRNKAENQLIFTVSHGNRFSLPTLEHISSEAVGEEDSSWTEYINTKNTMQIYSCLREWRSHRAIISLILCIF
ncbi:unnamed protein product [Trichobilharzia szidati]|nr:unnamed protein product [Trichobilharzia szidati]